jgi:hypothetical protein
MDAPYRVTLVGRFRPIPIQRETTAPSIYESPRLHAIANQAEHTLVELWNRRAFRCDCPTTAMQPEPSASSGASKRRRCALNPPQIQPADVNENNAYNRNFQGDFCRCGRKYDPLKETEGMLFCSGCQVRKSAG